MESVVVAVGGAVLVAVVAALVVAVAGTQLLVHGSGS